MNMEEEVGKLKEEIQRLGQKQVGKLKEEIQRLGQKQPNGSYKVTFGVIFNDDSCANIFEALVGTLWAAKKRKIVTYDGMREELERT